MSTSSGNSVVVSSSRVSELIPYLLLVIALLDGAWDFLPYVNADHLFTLTAMAVAPRPPGPNRP